MKKNSGVTMVELVIVLVIILMIVAFSVMSGRETLVEADVTEVYVEIDSMRKAVNSMLLKMDMDETFTIQEGVHYDTSFVPAPDVTYGSNVTGYQNDWYIIFGMNEKGIYDNSIVKETLGLDSIKRSYIVNYTTGEVELYEGVEIEGKKLRTFDEIRRIAEN